MEAEIAATESVDRATVSMDRLRAAVKGFGSEIKNDLASLKAASQRVQTESEQMRTRYIAAQQVLTSPEFERAIVNAERMAVALKALADLSQTDLSVSVLAGKSPAGQ